MGHYLSEMETSDEAAKRKAESDDITARLAAGFEWVISQDPDLWTCKACYSVVLGRYWRGHLAKAHSLGIETPEEYEDDES